MSTDQPLTAEQAARRRDMLQRLGAAAVLQTAAGYGAWQAWSTAQKLPESVRLQLVAAGRCPFESDRRAQVAAILAEHQAALDAAT